MLQTTQTSLEYDFTKFHRSSELSGTTTSNGQSGLLTDTKTQSSLMFSQCKTYTRVHALFVNEKLVFFLFTWKITMENYYDNSPIIIIMRA